ncbi:MAG: hypothetical protein ACOX3K_05525 [Bacilli bacterium]
MIKVNVYPGDIRLIEIRPSPDFIVTLCSFGASIFDIYLPDKNGKMTAVTARPESLQEFCTSPKYFGKSVGRVIGRIPYGHLDFAGQRYQLSTNEGDTTLHGGKKGFSYQNFHSVINEYERYIEVTFTKKMDHLEDSFPGDLEMEVLYRIWKEDFQIDLIYRGRTETKTVFNPSTHVYFNLNSCHRDDVLNHVLMIKADQVGRLDEQLRINGFEQVNQVHDFRKPKAIGQDVNADELQKHRAYGYDHTYVLNKEKRAFALATTLFSPLSGRTLAIYTDLPALNFYGGNYPDLSLKMKGSSSLTRYQALALEPQLFPRDVTGWTLTKESPYEARITFTFTVKR